METHAKPGEKGIKLPQVAPLTINDFYEKIKDLIGEVENDPHKLLREMRDAPDNSSVKARKVGIKVFYILDEAELEDFLKEISGGAV